MADISKIIKKQNRIYRLSLIVLSLLISAIVYNLFLLPLRIVTGGTSGIATITNYLYGIDPAIMLLAVSAALVMVSFMYLGIERTSGTIMASILYPVLVKLTSGVSDLINVDSIDILLVIIFAAVLNGVAQGLMYKSGYGDGGFSTISQILFNKFRIPVGKTSMAINVVIVLCGVFFFGTTNALYAIIYLYITSIVLDKVLLGISNNKAFYIMTEKEKEIKNYIINELKHTVTIFEVKGGFLDSKRNVMLTIIPSREYYRLTEGIKEIDSKAFFVVTDSYQVEGAK